MFGVTTKSTGSIGAHETFPSGNGGNSGLLPDGTTGNDELDEAVEIAGYAYDPKQDIFYSTMDPWQRHIGYCRLYDEAAALMGMIIDCEPINFEYRGKKWVVELWKGQYDLVAGCEIGVYKEERNLNIPGIFTGTFYTSVSNAERLQMSYVLKKNGKVLFTRQGKHWWLTGFKLGEFAEPSELTMDINITLLNETMRDAFVNGLRSAGYLDDVFAVYANTVSFTFDVPHTPQPMTRTPETDRLLQEKNRLLCEMYREVTGPYSSIQDKVKAVEEQSPEIYRKILAIGKTKKLYEVMAAIVLAGVLFLSLFTGGNSESATSELWGE